jgi:transcriptional regulator with XRE-family HTH domain
MPRTASSALDAKLLGERLRQARHEEGLTQAALAAELGVSPSYVQKLEGGRANPTLGQLANLARALGRTLEVDFAAPAENPDLLAEFATR